MPCHLYDSRCTETRHLYQYISKTRHTGRPPIAYPSHILRKATTRNLFPPRSAGRGMLVRIVKGILQQADIGIMHGAKHRPELRVAQPRTHDPRSSGAAAAAVWSSSCCASTSADASPAHVDDADESHARVGLVAVGGETVVDGVQQAQVAREPDPRGCVVLGPQLEDVNSRREEQRELKLRSDGRQRVGYRVVRWEDGDVEGVVLVY